MTYRRAKSLLCYVAFATCCVSQVAAQENRALIVTDDLARRDAALQLSETFLGLGFDVQRLEVPQADDLAAAMADLAPTTGVSVIYYAGESADVATYLRATKLPQFVFLDACVGPDLPDLPENVFVATQGQACDIPLSDAMLERLTVPGLGSDQWDFGADYRSVSTLDAPFVFRQPTQDVRLSAQDYAMLETLSPAARDRMVALWLDAGIPVDIAGVAPATPIVDRPVTVAVSPIRPVAPATVVSPIRPQAVSGGTVQPAQNITVITRPQTTLVTGPVAGQGGLPAPSILVGFVVDEQPVTLSTPDVPGEPVAGNTFGYEDPAAREELRNQDAALFGGLVEAGAFDPPEDEVARALQIELQRINCYTSGIDGAWGPGSQRALAEYYAQVGLPVSGNSADVTAFRNVIARNDVRCPDPVVAAPAPQAVAQPARQSQPAAAQSRRVAPAAAAPAPAPAPAAPAQPARRTINQTGGTGVFR